MTNKKQFLNEVTQQIRSKEAKEYVKKELHHHIEEAKQLFMKKGESVDHAEEKAVLQMGSPTQLGHRLNKIHRPKIDWILMGLISIVLGIGFLPLIVLEPLFEAVNLLSSKVIDVVIGVIILIAMMLFDYRKLKGRGWLFFLFGCVVLVFINVNWMITRINGTRFFEIGPFIISPVLTLPIFMIAWVDVLQKEKFNILQYFGMFFVSVMLIGTTNDIQFLGMYITLVSCMMLIRSLYKKEIKIWASLVITWIVMISSFVFSLQEYHIERIEAFLHPEKYADTGGYIYLKINDLITTAGWFGNSIVEGEYIPEAHTNFVFVAFTYSFGWVFAISLVLLLVSITIRISFIYRKIHDPFGSMLIVGSLSLFATAMIGNIGMAVGVFPITSIPLPFISYGLAPIVLNAAIIGLVLSVYRRKNLIIQSVTNI
ncbi:FtsW/RodA/SpoVE family cell cycle protein [Alkalihalobacillus sp. AL-G]|uniref:FtsW/RodA/SpoVE family cell cycle protein n=1 Tax=Alkalihalobacillus sp. AL-G TaxID=2926399 RepID=UPI00272DAF76|nr:FtsW/RodA/SpoVE family cell cycle protein [Alkalihalobacillus sp. AL-G]WLD91738.1 FtsW/RodA/SpoVE family cell cycle protein [Alkalihalobacillus sp. AL-G]